MNMVVTGKRGFQRTAGVFLAAGILMAAGTGFGQYANDGFNPDAGGSVYAIVNQPDGKILVGGSFGTIGGVARTYVGRIFADGRLDTTFAPGIIVPGSVKALALQSDGKVVIGGAFNQVAGQDRYNVARLNADGSLDAAFNPGANGGVMALAVQADGKIIVGGEFIKLGGQVITCIGRLNADGSLDTAFNPTTDGPIDAIALQPDGKIVVGGFFSLMGGQPRSCIARLNSDGSIDSTFALTNGADDTVRCLAIQADGKIIIGGDFATAAGEAHPTIARLNTDGSLDTSFNPIGQNHAVYTLVVQPDGKILVGGTFTILSSGGRIRIGRLNTDGTLDTTLESPGGTLDTVYALAVQADNSVLAGGAFHKIGGVDRNHIARLYPDGRTDQDFVPNAGNSIYACALQTDGNILIGGAFVTLLNGAVARVRIARLHDDSSVDTTFDPGTVGGEVLSLAVQSDGKALVAGLFTKLAAVDRNRIGRLNADGTLDAFNPNADGAVLGLGLQADGKITIGGGFDTLGGVEHKYVGRLNTDGDVDAAFTPVASGGLNAVFPVALQPDGKIVLGGFFAKLNNEDRLAIGRLNADGSLDTAFNPGVEGFVLALAIQPDGKILVGGAFTKLGGTACNSIGRLNADGSFDASFTASTDGIVYSLILQTDGRVLVGGSFAALDGIGRKNIGRLNTDGTLDTTFDLTDGANGMVNSLTLQADGKILVGGAFAKIGNEDRKFIARIANTDAALQSLSVDDTGSTISWLRTGTSPEVWRTTFEQSFDGSTWDPLGAGTRITNGWQITGVAMPVNQIFYIRARGYGVGGTYNNSASVYESVRLIYITPGVYSVSADYDGDNKADPTVYDEATGTWRVRLSSTEDYALVEIPAMLGGPGWRPVAADFDGDGKADPAVCQTATGTWRVRLSSTEDYALVEIPAMLGGPGWLPVAYDCDNDHKADPGVYEQATGTWQFKLSGSEYALLTITNWLGGSGYTPTLGDYDGDAQGDPGVYQEATGNWQIRFSKQSYLNIFPADAFVGGPGYNAAAADYDGDGRMDPSVFQPSTGNWKVRLSLAEYDEVDLPGFLK